MAALFLISLLLWKFPLFVARGLVNFREPGESAVSTASAEQIQIVGFTILDLYLLFYVLSDIVYWGFILFISMRNTPVPIEISTEQIGSIISTAIELIFVLFLLIGGKRIAELLRRIRYGEEG